MMKFLTCLAMLLPADLAVAQTPDWDPKFYDPPHPGAAVFTDDKVLPMPCGGKLVFRPVEVTAVTTAAGANAPPGPLDDRPVAMGDPDPDRGVVEYIRTENLAAPFVGPNGKPAYWIGKYVVSGDQYDAMLGHCEPASPKGRIAKTGVSQIDAMRAVAEWSAWLLKNARDQLPKHGEEFAYVRLPTEVEWEFAARGGAKVKQEEFTSRTWPMPEGIEHYVVAANMADGRPQQIGAEKLPNPLGLYGVLGSVDQMMLEPFRLNRVGRMHGEAGGVILRGGNFKASLDDLYTGRRGEMRPYDPVTAQPMRMPTVGFRVVLSATVSAGGQKALEDQKQEFAKLAKLGGTSAPAEDTGKLLASMRERAEKAEEKAKLRELEANLLRDQVARDDRDQETVRARIETAAVIANSVRAAERNALVLDAVADYAAKTEEKRALQAGQEVVSLLKGFQDKEQAEIKRIREVQDTSLDAYQGLLTQIATGPAAAKTNELGAIVSQQMQTRGQRPLVSLVAVVTKHVSVLRANGKLTRDQVRNDILTAPVR